MTKKSVLIEDFAEYKWEDQKISIKYGDIINYERAGLRGEHHCVMCGRIKGKQCEIPNQNKDVCKVCDCSYWRVLDGNIIVKFCKGCKKFSLLADFADKPEASKCAKCRERGRQNYYTRKQSTAQNPKKNNPKSTGPARVEPQSNHNQYPNPQYQYNLGLPYIVLPSIIPHGNSNSFGATDKSSPSSHDEHEHHGLMRCDSSSSSPDQAYTSQPSLSSSSSSHDGQSVDYHQDRRSHSHSSRSRLSDSDSSTGLFDQIPTTRSSRSSFPQTRSSTSSNLSNRLIIDTSSFIAGRPSSSSSYSTSSFASPHPLTLEIDPSIVGGLDSEGLYPSAASGDSSDIVSSSLSTIDTHNTSIGSVDVSLMMSSAIPKTPAEAFYTLHDTSFPSLHGIDEIPTPQATKIPQNSRQSNSSPSLISQKSKTMQDLRPPSTFDTNLSFLNTPSYHFSSSPPPTDSCFLDPSTHSLMNGLPITPLSSIGSPDGEPGETHLTMSSPTNNTNNNNPTGDYKWDPSRTPLQNLASVSETLRASNPNERNGPNEGGIAGGVPSNSSSSSAVAVAGTAVGTTATTAASVGSQRMTRSQSLLQAANVSQKPPLGPPQKRTSPRTSPRFASSETHLGIPHDSLLALSPVGLSSPKYLHSPDDQPDEELLANKRGRYDSCDSNDTSHEQEILSRQFSHSNIEISSTNVNTAMITIPDSQVDSTMDEINLSSSGMVSSSSLNTTNESLEDKPLVTHSRKINGKQHHKPLPPAPAPPPALRSLPEIQGGPVQSQGQTQAHGQPHENVNRRKRRRNNSADEDDNILCVAIPDSRSVSPINIPVLEEVN